MPGFKDVHSSHIPGRAICTKIGQCHVWSAGRGAGSARDPGNDGRHSPNDDPLPGADQPVRDCMRAQPWEQSGAGGLSRTPGGCSPACPSPVPPGPSPVPSPEPPIPPGGRGSSYTCSTSSCLHNLGGWELPTGKVGMFTPLSAGHPLPGSRTR